MKYFFVVVGLLVSGVFIEAQNNLPGPFSWDLLWAGSWEESKTLHNRGDFRLGFAFPERDAFSGKRTLPGFLIRAQALDRRTLNFQLDSPWGDPSKAISGGSMGLYHRASGSRLLYGVLDEWGLPARIRSPWIRSAPYAENHQPIMADLRTTVSSTKEPEAYLYLSSPRLGFFEGTALPVTVRGFASGQLPATGAVDDKFTPSFSGGIDTVLGKNTELLLEGFYTTAQLPARNNSSWFSNPPPLPDRDFRLGAAALILNTPYWVLSSDWAWSQTFAWGGGFYGNAGLTLRPPLPWNAAGSKPGPWSLSLAADGMSERYIGRDGSSPGGGLRAAGKIERKGSRSSLFRINTMVRGPAMDEPFDRSSSGIYYRFPAPPAGSSGRIPLRVRRISLTANRNASNPDKIHDGIDAALGLSLSLPPMSLPPALLTNSARKVKNPRPKSYPLGINLSASVDELGSFGGEGSPSPYPFFPANQAFDSAKTSCELLWSPGIFQFRTRWSYTAYAKKDNQWGGSVTSAVRFKYGRFSAKIAWPVFPEKWDCTLSWRLEY
jgi:hypothetical protein